MNDARVCQLCTTSIELVFEKCTEEISWIEQASLVCKLVDVELLEDLLDNLGNNLLQVGLLGLEVRELAKGLLDLLNDGEVEGERGGLADLGVVVTLADDVAVVGSSTAVPGKNL